MLFRFTSLPALQAGLPCPCLLEHARHTLDLLVEKMATLCCSRSQAFNSGADADLRWGNSLGVLFGMAIFFRCIAYLAYMRVAPQSKEQSTSGDAAGATESSALLPST